MQAVVLSRRDGNVGRAGSHKALYTMLKILDFILKVMKSH